MYLKLNGSGRVLWERLARRPPRRSSWPTLVETYGIDDEHVQPPTSLRSWPTCDAGACSKTARRCRGRPCRLRDSAVGSVRAVRLPPRELLTMLHCVAVITVVEVLIRWVPLPTLSRLLGVPVNLEPGPPDAELLPVGRLVQHARAAAALRSPDRPTMAVQPWAVPSSSRWWQDTCSGAGPGTEARHGRCATRAARPRVGRDRRPAARAGRWLHRVPAAPEQDRK